MGRGGSEVRCPVLGRRDRLFTGAASESRQVKKRVLSGAHSKESDRQPGLGSSNDVGGTRPTDIILCRRIRNREAALWCQDCKSAFCVACFEALPHHCGTGLVPAPNLVVPEVRDASIVDARPLERAPRRYSRSPSVVRVDNERVVTCVSRQSCLFPSNEGGHESALPHNLCTQFARSNLSCPSLDSSGGPSSALAPDDTFGRRAIHDELIQREASGSSLQFCLRDQHPP